MNTPTSDRGVEKSRLTGALARREIWILILVGSLMFVSALVIQGRMSAQTSEVLLRGIQDLGLSLIEAALVMIIIEQIEQSLELIGRATGESKKLIAESIEETI